MKIPRKVWNKFIDGLIKIDEAAGMEMLGFFERMDEWGKLNDDDIDGALIAYAHVVTTKYGESASALCSEMYDALAEFSGKTLPPAEPAPPATYNETARAVRGARLFSKDPKVTASAVSRLVKQVGEDTLVKNALRDGAEWAWIPHGDTCAFCLTLASRGWQKASKRALKNGHVEHIHNNCDCSYAVRFDSDTTVEGYDPDKYYEQYQNADGRTPQAKINAMRREAYAKNKAEINAQKRSAYAKRKELESSAAEEIKSD